MRCVYIVQAIGTHYYKIGVTDNLDKRIYGLQREMPFYRIETVKVHYTDRNRELERVLHRLFKRQCLNSTEWFELSPDDLSTLTMDTVDLLDSFDLQENQMSKKLKPLNREPGKKPKKEYGTRKADVEKAIAIPAEPKRLRRMPEGETIADEDMPTIQDEFQYGLLPEMVELHEQLGSWQAVGKHYRIPKEEAWYIATYEQMPMDNQTRAKLGLCTFQTAKDYVPPEGII